MTISIYNIKFHCIEKEKIPPKEKDIIIADLYFFPLPMEKSFHHT